eukprot:UN27790
MKLLKEHYHAFPKPFGLSFLNNSIAHWMQHKNEKRNEGFSSRNA